jgi:hypothetical protein
MACCPDDLTCAFRRGGIVTHWSVQHRLLLARVDRLATTNIRLWRLDKQHSFANISMLPLCLNEFKQSRQKSGGSIECRKKSREEGQRKPVKGTKRRRENTASTILGHWREGDRI